ncbi:DUF5713 family protein [Gemella sp. zg-570]|uniref:DUF5713 family protein n=1 Tax=Gemella sp. zg-570 TaxID=2840371 RepID=UPI00352D8196
MKEFDKEYRLLKEIVNDDYYQSFIVQKIKSLILPVIELLENGEKDIAIIQKT